MTIRSVGLRAALASLVLASMTVSAQQAVAPAPTPLHYDVVSVKENKSGDFVTILNYDRGDTLKIQNANLMTLVTESYDLHSYLVEGMPKWGQSQHFDLQGKILDAAPDRINALTIDQRRAMLRAIIQDRFALKTHWVTRQMPEYDLVVARGGSKLKESKETRTSSGLNMDALDATRITTDDLAKALGLRLEKPVVNQTGLSGRYDIKLKWSMEGQTLNGEQAQDTDAAPSMFTAVKETLGLELKPTRGPVQVLVVDSAQPPASD